MRKRPRASALPRRSRPRQNEGLYVASGAGYFARRAPSPTLGVLINDGPCAKPRNRRRGGISVSGEIPVDPSAVPESTPRQTRAMMSNISLVISAAMLSASMHELASRRL